MKVLDLRKIWKAAGIDLRTKAVKNVLRRYGNRYVVDSQYCFFGIDCDEYLTSDEYNKLVPKITELENITMDNF